MYKTLSEQQPYSVTVEHIKKQHFIQWLHIGSPTLLAQSIQGFIHFRKQAKLSPAEWGIYNLLYDDPMAVEPEHYRFGLACKCPLGFDLTLWPELPVSIVSLPELDWAVLAYQGPEHGVGDAIAYMYGEWLINQAKTPAPYPLVLNRISHSPDVSNSVAKIEIMLPLI